MPKIKGVILDKSVRSAYFDNNAIFPSGTIAFDHALLMREVLHEWHSQEQMIGQIQP